MLDKAKIPYKSIQAVGREHIQLEDSAGRIEFRTRSSKGGLGEGFDLLVIDEAQEYTDDQASALKYVVTDSENPQTLFCGTPPTPVSSGTVFLKMRNAALRGDTQNTGWAEWSVEQQTDPHDVEAWYRTNPSLGTIFTERSVADEIGDDPIDFNIQRLGLWLRYNLKSAISRTEWDELKVDALQSSPAGFMSASSSAPMAPAVRWPLPAGPKKTRYSWKPSTAALPGQAADGSLIFCPKPTLPLWRWTVPRQQLLARRHEGWPVSKHRCCPRSSRSSLPMHAFEQAVFARSLLPCRAAGLTQTASNCEKRAIGSNGGFGYRSLTEGGHIELLDSVILAHWQCAEGKAKRRQRTSY